MSIDNNNLAHSTWNCKYHIVFAPKYRRKVFYGQKRRQIGAILRRLCEHKKVNIIEAEICPDHVHMLLEIPPKMLVLGFVGYLKGKSSVLIYQEFTSTYLKYRHREFWCAGHYVDTAGKNTKKIQEYIANQYKENKVKDPISMFEPVDPLAQKKSK